MGVIEPSQNVEPDSEAIQGTQIRGDRPAGLFAQRQKFGDELGDLAPSQQVCGDPLERR